MVMVNDLFEYDILDRNGNAIGDADAFWRDEATGRLEFVGVEAAGEMTGGEGDLVIPLTNAVVDENERAIRVPFDMATIRSAPRFAEKDLSDDDELAVYTHFGVPPPTEGAVGVPADLNDRVPAPGATERGTMEERRLAGRKERTAEEARIPLAEEELEVGKRKVETGGVKLRKIVETEHVEVPVELRREEIHIDRVRAEGRELPDDAFEEREIEMTATREEPVARKEAHLTGEVRAYKTEETERRDVEADLRREKVDVDRDADRDRI